MPWRKPKIINTFRDVSIFWQYLREFFLGRKHTLHGRFPPYISPRSIPPAEVPRGVEYKYSNQYYCNRSYSETSMPPVIAPIAEGPPIGYPKFKKPIAGGMRPDLLCFPSAPTPGPVYWWDGHCYYESIPEKQKPRPPCPQINMYTCDPPESTKPPFEEKVCAPCPKK